MFLSTKMLNIVMKEQRGNEIFYYLDSLKTISDIKEIIRLIEEDGYDINMLKINFIHDDAIFIAPKIYDSSLDFLYFLKNMENEDIEIEYIGKILYNAEKGNAVRQGAIHIDDKVISCTEFDRGSIC